MDKNEDHSKLSLYKCPACKHSWWSNWDSFCDDECSCCGYTCSPVKEIDLEEEKIPHATMAIDSVTVTDPETNSPVVVKIRKDLTTGAMIGLDASHLEQDISEGIYYDPYNEGETLYVPDDE